MQIIITFDSNLFAIAASQLGSALQWINIARANGVVDPFLSGRNTISIPPFSPALDNGIGPQ